MMADEVVVGVIVVANINVVEVTESSGIIKEYKTNYFKFMYIKYC